MIRRLAIILLILALIPTIYVRQPWPPASRDHRVTYHDLLPGLVRQGMPRRFGQLQLVGAWQLTSRNRDFGNFSGLAERDSRDLVAVSDRNATLVFTRPDKPAPWRPCPRNCRGCANRRSRRSVAPPLWRRRESRWPMAGW